MFFRAPCFTSSRIAHPARTLLRTPNIPFSSSTSNVTSILTSLLNPDPPSMSSSKVQLARDFATLYPSLPDPEKLQTLRFLYDNYGTDTLALSQTLRTLTTSASASLSQKSAATIRKLSTPKYEALFSRILTDVPRGMETIVSIRSDLRRLDRKAEV